MHVAIYLTLALASGSASERAEFLKLYQPLEYTYTGGRYEDQAFKYRLLDPRTDASKKKFPLLVWLHGLGEAGEDNRSQLRYLDTLITPKPWRPERFPFFVLAVQCPRDNPGWGSGDPENKDEMLSVLTEILDKTLEENPIDRDRIYLSGVSSGGGGTWRFAYHRPDYFAAIAPLSGGALSPTVEEIAALRQIPIWVFNCVNDDASPIESVRELVQSLDEAGVNVHLSEIPIASHDSWSAAFADYGLRSWLLSQRRGNSQAPPPGTVSFVQSLIMFYHMPFFDVLQGWSWLQLAALGYLATVLMVIGRWANKHGWLPTVRIRMCRSRRKKNEGLPDVQVMS